MRSHAFVFAIVALQQSIAVNTSLIACFEDKIIGSEMQPNEMRWLLRSSESNRSNATNTPRAHFEINDDGFLDSTECKSFQPLLTIVFRFTCCEWERDEHTHTHTSNRIDTFGTDV